MIIVFPLITHGDYRYNPIVLDLKQDDIARNVKWDQQLSQKMIAMPVFRFAAGKGA